MADIGPSAFSLFFMQSESFLSYQRLLDDERKTSNCHTLFGVAKIPTDNHIRSMLDPVHPSHLQSSFDQVVTTLRTHGGMKEFERLGGRALIALDETEYFCSYKLGCPHCQTRKRSNVKTEFYHSILAATLVAPGHNMVVPLMPEFIVKRDGAEPSERLRDAQSEPETKKQDCERSAAKQLIPSLKSLGGHFRRDGAEPVKGAQHRLRRREPITHNVWHASRVRPMGSRP